jgi:hypothetical protein
MDSTAGCKFLIFLDCYSGYHQIHIKGDDHIKTSFISTFGAFCYTTMTYGLKSAGATYKRCLHTQLGCNAEVYIDNVVIKTQEDEGLISNRAKTFDIPRNFKMKVNPERCTFNVPSGKLHGNMISWRGIDPNLEKVSAITKMKLPESLHDVQMLTGCMTAFSRFISKLGMKGLPFFKLLKKQDKF